MNGKSILKDSDVRWDEREGRPRKVRGEFALPLADTPQDAIKAFLLENADEVIKTNDVKLIVLDSLTAHFRSEYVGREMLVARQQRLNKHMHKLIGLARAFNTVAVVTNQVMAKPGVFFGDAVHPVGGHVVGHTSHTRVYLRRASQGPVRIARLVSSPYLPEGEEILKITENGIEDTSVDERNKPRGR